MRSKFSSRSRACRSAATPKAQRRELGKVRAARSDTAARRRALSPGLGSPREARRGREGSNALAANVLRQRPDLHLRLLYGDGVPVFAEQRLHSIELLTVKHIRGRELLQELLNWQLLIATSVNIVEIFEEFVLGFLRCGLGFLQDAFLKRKHGADYPDCTRNEAHVRHVHFCVDFGL